MQNYQKVEHYENFPVERLFIPQHLRPAVAAVYHFARYADDLADEGDHTDEQRLAGLQQLDDEVTGKCPASPLVSNLLKELAPHHIDTQLCRDLLVAFSQDVTKSCYENEAERLRYCRYSANPIGRMMLQLFKQDSPAANTYADELCTALQLINFMQDIVSDFTDRERSYLLQTDLDLLQISRAELLEPASQPQRQQLITRDLARIDAQLKRSERILAHTHGRLHWQLSAIIAMAKTVMRKLQQRGANWEDDCHLSKIKDGPRILLQTLQMGIKSGIIARCSISNE